MDKEKWTEEILKSLDELQLVNPEKGLYNEILSKLQPKEQPTIPISWIVSIAASFLLLVSLNVSFMNQNSIEDQSSEAESLISQFDNNTTNQLYEE